MEQIDNSIKELISIRAQVKELNKKEENLKDLIKGYLKVKGVSTYSGDSVSAFLELTEQERVDRDKVQVLLGSDFKQVLKLVPVETLRVKNDKSN